jgi:hypothetical protein
MKMQRLNIQLPANLKAKLDALRTQGTTASGYITSRDRHDRQDSAARTFIRLRSIHVPDLQGLPSALLANHAREEAV